MLEVVLFNIIINDVEEEMQIKFSRSAKDTAFPVCEMPSQWDNLQDFQNCMSYEEENIK